MANTEVQGICPHQDGGAVCRSPRHLGGRSALNPQETQEWGAGEMLRGVSVLSGFVLGRVVFGNAFGDGIRWLSWWQS